MGALEQIAAARNDAFAARILMLALTTAQNVAAEDEGTPQHDARHDYAERILRGDENPKLLAAHVIASNPTIRAEIDKEPAQQGANIPDADIEFALASIWTARALAFRYAPKET